MIFVIVFARSVCGQFLCLVEAAAAEVVGDDDIGDCVEHELNIVGVGGACHVAVDLLGGRLVLRLELRLYVCSRLAVLLRSCTIQMLH